MRCFSVRGFTAATGGTAGEVVCQLWNPSGSEQRIWLVELGFWRGGITANRYVLRRLTARGTPGSTITPDADNAWDGEAGGPPSGALFDLADFSVEPTMVTRLESFFLAGITGSEGFGATMISEEGICIQPGAGLALSTENTAVVPTSEVSVVWLEEAD